MVHGNGSGRDMPAAVDSPTNSNNNNNPPSAPYHSKLSWEQSRKSNEWTRTAAADASWPHTANPNGMPAPNGNVQEGMGGKDGGILSVPNGGERAPSAKSMKSRRSAGNLSATNLSEAGERRSGEAVKEVTARPGAAEEGYFAMPANGKPGGPPRSPLKIVPSGEPTNAPSTSFGRSMSHGGVPATPSYPLPPLEESSPQAGAGGLLKPPAPTTHKAQRHRASSSPAYDASNHRLTHRNTLEVPKPGRSSKDGGDPTAVDGVFSVTGRFSPATPTRRRASLQLGRRNTRSIHSDMHLDEVQPDDDAARWAEHIRAKRASKKQRADTDDDRVVVGTKVDQNHVNFVTAYNMLTGIRCCVSRTNAKLDRDITDADFKTKHKFSFDISGSELTPSSKYDFKFKDYAPFVFRKLRANFQLDPADYLMSLTSKYILSELGSPGKSGSFFYFSRDYKYIIKTIHHGEHKFLRQILRDYYSHVTENPNTLLSQFYGLHRVKIPYGRKIHFVVMNNLFPPHRDIHRTFDLKGSTIGRDFKEDDLEKNPRATLKDLNWLRRNLHLEFGPTKKDAFVTQMQKDVALLQRLKIMDYSLLVGIHDLDRGNEENLRDKTLQVFQPGGETREEPIPGGTLARTPSKLESARRIKEMRESVKKERPIPISQTLDRLPDEAHKSPFYFYADDGGFRATHEDDTPGEEIYYLGIIDCLTRYNTVKRLEHFWKGMGGHESQISPIPPERYGDRFVRFISGVTMSRERAEKARLSATLRDGGITVPSGIEGTLHDPVLGGMNVPAITRDHVNPPGTERVMQKAEHMAEKSRRKGSNEEESIPDRSLMAVSSPGDLTLPVIGEAGENSSNFSRTPSHHHATPRQSREQIWNPAASSSSIPPLPMIGNADMPSDAIGEVPPPTPPKMDGSVDTRRATERQSWGGRPPPTPPKDLQQRPPVFGKDKELPLPPSRTQFSASPMHMSAASSSEEDTFGLGGGGGGGGPRQ